MKTFSFVLILALCMLAFGCGDPATNTTNANATNTATNMNANTAAPDTNANADKKDDAADSDKAEAVTGVAACDEYLESMEKFLDNPKVPQATRDASRKAFEQNRDAWKQAASTPQGKAGLEAGCKAALDAAKSTWDQFN
jgi:hypothetical protein